MPFLGATLYALALPLLIAWRGYVLSVLWAWFVVPQFGLAPLSIPAALGISLLVGMVAREVHWNKESNHGWEQVAKSVFFGVFSPALFLLVGWLYTWFMP